MLLTNDKGEKVQVAQGFNWKVLFFGGFVPLFEDDIELALKMFVLCFFTAGLSDIYFGKKYNEMKVKSLLEKGYEVIE